MKRHLSRIFTLPNIVIILSALFIVYKLYELPEKVNNLEGRISVVEKENVTLKTKLDLCLNAIYEMRADIKQIIKDIK